MEAPGRIAVREFEVPDPEPGAVVMRVSLSGICGTGKHTFRGESKQYSGDRIVPGANVPCGNCVYCLGDYPYYFCQHQEDYGISLNCLRPPHLFGGWSEYLYLLPGTPIFGVPESLPDEVAVIDRVVTHRFALGGAADAVITAQSGEAMQVVIDPAAELGSWSNHSHRVRRENT
jgi:threonine dehydrogenase-like Zn-dependent dehydrogenase